MSVGKSQSRSSSGIWNEQAPYLQNLYSNAQGLLNNTDPQSLVPGFTGNQLLGQQSALGFANNGGRDLYGQASGAFNFGLNAANLNENPYFGSALDAAIRPLTEQYRETVLPGIGHSATQAGQPGSSRQGVAEALASRDYLRQVGDTSATMANNAYGQGLNTMLGTLGQAGTVANLGLLPSQIQQDVGSQQYALQQAQARAPFDLLGLYQSLIGPAVTQSSGRGDSFNFGSNGNMFNPSGGG